MPSTATVQVQVAKGYKPLIFTFSEGQNHIELISNFCSKFNFSLIIQKTIQEQIQASLPWNWCTNMEERQQLIESQYEESFIEEESSERSELEEISLTVQQHMIDTPIQRLKYGEEEKICFDGSSSKWKNKSKKASTMGTETPVRWLNSEQEQSESPQTLEDPHQTKVCQKHILNDSDQKSDKKANKIFPLSFLSFRQARNTCFSPQGSTGNLCEPIKVIQRRQSQRYAYVRQQ